MGSAVAFQADAPAPIPGRVGRIRAVIATLAFVALLVGTLGYHDGAFDVDPIGSAREPGLYRLKGTVESWDAGDETIRLRDGSGEITLHWNAKIPDVDRLFVVSAELSDRGNWTALSLSRVYFFREPWM